MLGGQNTQPRGYTIVEVMIFLAVSGLMFVVAAIFISGKQSNIEFRQGMENINTKIQNVVNEVANGEFPSQANFACTASSTSEIPPTFPNGSKAQGTNGDIDQAAQTSGCIFLGKIIQFAGGTNPTGYYVYSVAARQLTTDNQAVQTFLTAKPKIMYNPGYFDTTETDTTEGGLSFTSATYCSAPASGAGLCSGATQPISAFGFFGSFNAGAAAGDLQSGAQSVTTVYVPGGSTPSNDETTRINTINGTLAGLDNDEVRGGASIVLCFNNGRGRKGSIQVGGNGGQQFTTTLSYIGAGCP